MGFLKKPCDIMTPEDTRQKGTIIIARTKRSHQKKNIEFQNNTTRTNSASPNLKTTTKHGTTHYSLRPNKSARVQQVGTMPKL